MLDPFAAQYSNFESLGLMSRRSVICSKAACWTPPTYSDGKACSYFRGLRGIVLIMFAVGRELDEAFHLGNTSDWQWKSFLIRENDVMYVLSIFNISFQIYLYFQELYHQDKSFAC